MQKTGSKTKTLCYHCGEDCLEDSINFDEKAFCCRGCKLVYEVLTENNLCNYYQLDTNPGLTQSTPFLGDRYSYLENPKIESELIRFKDKESVHLCFHIPAMHCSSCIWLLEHLGRLEPGVIRSHTDFIQKEVSIVYDPSKTTIRRIVEKLHQIGYPPELNLKQLEKGEKVVKSRGRIYKIGVAGFAFGNIMLLSFPEYFSGGIYDGEDFSFVFGYLILFLATPVFFFSAGEFLENALLSFRQRTINIDVPIAIGIVAMFLRSSYEILSHTGPGYFDSMTGLVFFMLIGRNFQSKTYEWLSFDRDYKSYFPIAVTRIKGQHQEAVSVHDLKVNDHVFIRNLEIIPADILLVSESADIDYSFVTGESRPVRCVKGDRIFAGGRLNGTPAEAIIQQEVSQSYLTQLWNQSTGKTEQKSGFQKMVEKISRWFVVITLVIATGSFAYWYDIDFNRAIHAFTSVLVIACACALALSAPFTFGNMLRILGRKGIYLKNATVLEKLSDIDSVVFDKTGTLTVSENATIEYHGKELSEDLKTAIAELANSSSHPLSRILSKKYRNTSSKSRNLQQVKESEGLGIEGLSNHYFIRLGSNKYLNKKEPDAVDFRTSTVGLEVDGEYYGHFNFFNKYRTSAPAVIATLQKNGYLISVISGDHAHERGQLESITGQKERLKFEQKPEDKLEYVLGLQKQGQKVMMVGDGINDAVALLNSHVGLAVAEDINNFTPGCDGIILSKNFGSIASLLSFAKSGQRIIVISFIISLLYNFTGLWFAVQGNLSPVIAAILMPISTSSLVLYTVIASSYKANRLLKDYKND